MVKVGAIIQARLGSERLPNKALLPLPFSGGPALLAHVVQRAKAAANVKEVIVATTEKFADNAIQQFCEHHSVLCFRGSADDVLGRFVQAGQQHTLDVVVRLTGDNPFISPEAVHEAVEAHVKAGVDYTITAGLPLGTNIEVVSFPALATAAAKATEPGDREHVTPYVRREPNFKRQELQLSSTIPQLRLTVDYPSDYALASLLYEKLYKKGETLFGFSEIEQLLQESPWLGSINAGNTQRKAFTTEVAELEEAESVLRSGGFSRVLQMLKEIKHDE